MMIEDENSTNRCSEFCIVCYSTMNFLGWTVLYEPWTAKMGSIFTSRVTRRWSNLEIPLMHLDSFLQSREVWLFDQIWSSYLWRTGSRLSRKCLLTPQVNHRWSDFRLKSWPRSYFTCHPIKRMKVGSCETIYQVFSNQALLSCKSFKLTFEKSIQLLHHSRTLLYVSSLQKGSIELLFHCCVVMSHSTTNTKLLHLPTRSRETPN